MIRCGRARPPCPCPCPAAPPPPRAQPGWQHFGLGRSSAQRNSTVTFLPALHPCYRRTSPLLAPELLLLLHGMQVEQGGPAHAAAAARQRHAAGLCARARHQLQRPRRGDGALASSTPAILLNQAAPAAHSLLHRARKAMGCSADDEQLVRRPASALLCLLACLPGADGAAQPAAGRLVGRGPPREPAQRAQAGQVGARDDVQRALGLLRRRCVALPCVALPPHIRWRTHVALLPSCTKPGPA